MQQTFNIRYDRYRLNISIAYEALAANKVRSLLSALGIVFGVAAVICMLAIGKGTEQEILDKMKAVGLNNIIIEPFSPEKSGENKDKEKGEDSDKQEQPGARRTEKYSPGLRISDIQAAREVLTNVTATSPYIEKIMFASAAPRYAHVSVKGVSAEYFSMFSLSIKQGTVFSPTQATTGSAVAILSESARLKLFGTQMAIGKKIKLGPLWFTVVGTLQDNEVPQKNKSNPKLDVYIPVQSYLSHVENRTKQAQFSQQFMPMAKNNTNQLDKIIIQINNTEELQASSQVLERMLLRTHAGVKDYKVLVPELMLKQQGETKKLFNLVLGIIAGISLLVGGIGIMNIMNASVLERTREIGVRLAVGANKKDISSQFLAEAILICLAGGIIGVISGIILSVLITQITGIATVITLGAVFTAFTVTVAVGIFFGYYPAKKASTKDPIESLRYE